MMGEENVRFGWQEIGAVIFENGSSRAGRIHSECPLDEPAVKSSPQPIAEERCAENTEEERSHTAGYCRRAGFRASMPDMNTTIVAGVLGFIGVALGAFGAHGLKNILAANDTTSIWQTAVLYHLLHAVAALWASERRPSAVWLWTAGVIIFSGSLYILAVTNIRWLGAVTPVGGLLLLAGWTRVVFSKSKAQLH
jgi:uncharacterized membrane protein YgdD (TMEM256/DUF423 family)